MPGKKLKFLEDKWDESLASKLDGPELLRYRSNLLGSDLRITNFGGGNTSSKLDQADPLDGQTKKVLWVKGSGGDLGSIQRSGFATLYQDKLLALEKIYPGVAREDEMVAMYPLITFGNNPVAASIDTPLHGYLPALHVDHLHPDWAIALAASANGKQKMEEFSKEFGHTLVWLPWLRPGFELALMLKRAIESNPACDGIILGGHGLFTWGDTQRESYLSTITIIDQIGQFIERHAVKGAAAFGGEIHRSRDPEARAAIAQHIFPHLRGAISRKQRRIGSFTDAPDVLEFVNSAQAQKLAYLGTSCPDHFIRTKIRPMYIAWDPKSDAKELVALIDSALETYRAEYADYYKAHALKDSPRMRDASPAAVLVPGIGMFSFGKNKTESRLIGEFFTNAIHVMQGAGSLGGDIPCTDVPQAGPAAGPAEFTVYENYVALPPSEAFRIEYWALEDAKIQRQPPEKELSRRIALIVGGGSGIGREVALLAAQRGAHIVVADCDTKGAEAVCDEARALAGKETVAWTAIDIRDRKAIRAALDATVKQFGGIDILINTAAIFPSSPDGIEANVTANHMLTDEAYPFFSAQGLDASVVLTSSANAIVAANGSEAYDVSQAALSHLVRELAVIYSPRVRVNGILTHVPIDPKACAEAILFLAGPLAPATTGHVIPVDGGIPEAFLR